MMLRLRTASLAVAAGGLVLSVPASAVPAVHAGISSADYGVARAAFDDDDDDDRYERRWRKQERRDRYERRYDRYRGDYRGQGRYGDYRTNYGEPVYNNTRVWRGDDGRVYCRKSDGTTGLIIGGAAGALLGREIAGRGDRTLGAILGAAGGALLGKSIDSKTTCR